MRKIKRLLVLVFKASADENYSDEDIKFAIGRILVKRLGINY